MGDPVVRPTTKSTCETGDQVLANPHHTRPGRRSIGLAPRRSSTRPRIVPEWATCTAPARSGTTKDAKVAKDTTVKTHTPAAPTIPALCVLRALWVLGVSLIRTRT